MSRTVCVNEPKISFKKKDLIVAALGRKHVGYIAFHYSPRTRRKRNVEIDFVFVEPGFRNLGIASKMILFLVRSHPKATWISLWTGEEIEERNGTNLYVRNGFKKLAHQKDYYKPGVGISLFGMLVKSSNGYKPLARAEQLP